MAWQWLMFSKHLQSLDFERLGDVVADMGFDGVDLTVRDGGHIEPADAKTHLPLAVKMLRRCGLTVPMITTAFTAAEEPFADAVFAVAADNGVRFVKLGYWRYHKFGTLSRCVDAARRGLNGIAQLAERYGICAVVHTHSGNFLTASAFVLAELLRDFSPHTVAAYVDAGHMFVEGGLTGWQQGLEVVADRVRVVACKDFAWMRDGERWHAKVVPIGDGIVRWQEFFTCLRCIGFDGPLSVHSEYQGAGSWRDLSLDELIAQTRTDLQRLKALASPP